MRRGPLVAVVAAGLVLLALLLIGVGVTHKLHKEADGSEGDLGPGRPGSAPPLDLARIHTHRAPFVGSEAATRPLHVATGTVPGASHSGIDD